MSTTEIWDSEPMDLFSSDDEYSDSDSDSDDDESESDRKKGKAIDDWEIVYRRLITISKDEDLPSVEIINELEKLAIEATTPAQLLQILLHILNHRFSLLTVPPGIVDRNLAEEGHLSAEAWNSVIPTMSLVLNLVQQYPNIIINQNQLYNPKETKKQSDYYGNIYIHGDLGGYIQKLERHLSMRFQCLNFFTASQFLEIFQYEARLFVVVKNIFQYFHDHQDYKSASIASLVILKIVHCKTNHMYDLLRKALLSKATFVEQDIPVSQSFVIPSPLPSMALPKYSADFMDHITSYIYEFGDDWIKVHATLYHIYHSAIIDNYKKGVEIGRKRGLLNLYNMTVSTQLLFNRAVAQLGLSAFRAGLPEQACHLLCMFGDCEMAEELLAQGHPRTSFFSRTIDLQFQERRRCFPYHMRINIDHLQSALQTCSLYMERSHELPLAPVRQKYTGIPKMVQDHLLFIKTERFQIPNTDALKSLEFWIRKKDKMLECD